MSSLNDWHNGRQNLPPGAAHSRPNQPPPPPPLPSVPPVPPTRDSSIAISRAAIHNKQTPIPPPQQPPISGATVAVTTIGGSQITSARSPNTITTSAAPTNIAAPPNVSPAITALSTTTATTTNGMSFLSQFEHLFKPISELPPPEPFMNKPKSYPSQRAQQKQPT